MTPSMAQRIKEINEHLRTQPRLGATRRSSSGNYWTNLLQDGIRSSHCATFSPDLCAHRLRSGPVRVAASGVQQPCANLAQGSGGQRAQRIAEGHASASI